MKRVQVESPFAPQTPLPDGECPTVGTRNAWPCSDYRCGYCNVRRIREKEASRNARYLAACLRDCLLRGESPYASHGLLTLPGVLRDDVPEERELGIRAGFAMREGMHATVFYTDLGWSRGMRAGEDHAIELIRYSNVKVTGSSPGHIIEYRELGPDWDK